MWSQTDLQRHFATSLLLTRSVSVVPSPMLPPRHTGDQCLNVLPEGERDAAAHWEHRDIPMGVTAACISHLLLSHSAEGLRLDHWGWPRAPYGYVAPVPGSKSDWDP